jgi:ABC-type glycerol-3-phosphate transport system permease component
MPEMTTMPTSTDAPQRSAPRGETPIRPFQPRRTRGFSPMREARPLTYIALTLAVLVFVFPLYWMFVVATRGNAAIAQRPQKVVPGTGTKKARKTAPKAAMKSATACTHSATGRTRPQAPPQPSNFASFALQ